MLCQKILKKILFFLGLSQRLGDFGIGIGKEREQGIDTRNFISTIRPYGTSNTKTRYSYFDYSVILFSVLKKVKWARIFVI